MISVIDVAIQSANPSMPLFPWRAFRNSYSSVRVRNVPRKNGKWNITNVTVQVTYPDGSIKTADAVLTGGVWVATLEGTATAGTSLQGYKILASGIDENGQPVSNYCLGRGDVTILEDDGELIPENVITYTRLLSAEPSEPKTGDLWQVSGSWYVYQDGQAWPIGDDSGLISQLSAELSNKADISWVSQQLTNYERKANMKSDVSSIVTAKVFTDWNYPAEIDGNYYAPDTDWLNEHGDHDKAYYLMNVEYVGEESWSIDIWSYTWWDDPDFGSWQPQGMYQQTIVAPEDTLSLTLAIPEELGGGTLTLTREYVNEIGLVMMSDLSVKQDKLTDPQISAIDSVVEERTTTIAFDLAGTSSYNWSGEINMQTLVDAGIYDDTEQTWLMHPTTINFGTGVTGIGVSAFAGCGTLGTVTIPDSVTGIGTSAFANCDALTSVTIDNGVKTVGDYAFQNCSSLLQVTLPQGMTSIGVDAFGGTVSYFMLYITGAIPTFLPSIANYPWGVSNTANIKTLRNATIEWVEEQAYGKGFLWRNATVNVRKTCYLNPSYINALTLTAARASFTVMMNTTTASIARDAYFSLTLGNFEQPMTWDTPFDVFEGGSAAAIAPKPNTTNIYHIFEYASGHFMVEKFGAAYDELGDIETIVNAI